jgi:hypothetical protein
MAILKSRHATGSRPVASVLSALAVGLLYEYTTEAAALAVNDIIALGPLEADVKPIDVTLITDDLDTGAGLTLTVGILNAAGTDIDAAATSTWIAASTVGQAGGVARATNANAFLSGRSASTRQLGIKVVTAPAGSQGAGKKIAVIVSATS